MNLYKRVAACVALLACVALGSDHHQGSCQCGLVGPSCDETGFVTLAGEVRTMPVLEFVDSNCTDVARTYGCFVNDGKARCACRLGYTGAACDVELEMWLPMQVFAGVIVPVLGIVLCAYLLRRKLRQGGGPAVGPADCVQGRGSRKVILAVRLVALCMAIASLVLQTQNALYGYLHELRYLSAHTFLLLVAYFAVASWLSIKACWTGVAEDAPLSRLEYAFWVLMEVLLPVSAMIAVVIWAIFFPISLEDGRHELLLTPGSYSRHGLNAAALLVDYTLNGLRFAPAHIFFPLFYIGGYQLLHSVFMFVDASAGRPHAPSYDFLISTDPLYPVWLLCVVAMVCIVFFLFRGLDRLLKSQGEEVVEAESKGQVVASAAAAGKASKAQAASSGDGSSEACGSPADDIDDGCV